MMSEDIRSDPWYRATLTHDVLGQHLRLAVPHDVFSTVRIDDGTLLLLDHLPASSPSSVLDMGCGYGALGLPVAAKYKDARVVMVDRDLLAVHWTMKNAAMHGITNVSAYGSIGYRNIPADERFDWILCNVPARIGRPFIRQLLLDGRSRLTAGGDMRIVIINDLIPVLEDIGAAERLTLVKEAQSVTHAVYAMRSSPSQPVSEPDTLYLRDTVMIDGLSFDRPFDIGGDDPRRLKSALPIMLDATVNYTPARVLIFRAGYGILPVIARRRFPRAHITAAERDMLGADYCRRNAEKHQCAGEGLSIREGHHFPAMISEDNFDLVIGELSPSAGKNVALAEIDAAAQVLGRNGTALLLTLEKNDKEWIRPAKKLPPLTRLISRDGYVLYHVRRSLQ